jgi:hypothetical protein
LFQSGVGVDDDVHTPAEFWFTTVGGSQ